MELLTTKRLVLREWEESDATTLIAITEKPNITHWLPDWRSCREWATPWICKNTKQGYAINNPMEYFMTWAITLRESGQLIGMINIGSDEYDKKEVGTGYFIDMDYVNKGYMTEALEAFCAYIFKTYRYDHIVATIRPDNMASIAVIQKCGFKYIKNIESQNGGYEKAEVQKYFRLENPNNH